MLPISFSFLHPAVGLLLPGIYASPRRTRRAVAPDVWHHRLKADGPSLCAVRKRQGEENYCWLTPVLIKQTVPTDDTSGGVEMYRNCYTMKLAYPCEADGCRCGSGCLRTRPDCNRTADEDSYSNCDVIPHSGLHTIEQAVNKSRHQGRTDHLSRSRWRRGLVRSAMLKQARGKPDQTRSIPRKGYICRAAVA